MKAVVFERFGEPAEVLHIAEVPRPEPGPNEVRVRMVASPINPSDMMVVRGRYGRLPKLPATPGFEGVGVIDAVGPGLLRLIRGLSPGKRVAVFGGETGNWQEYVVISAKRVVPLPADISDEQGATFFVNPATVLAMVQHVLKVPAGAWLLQSAAASALGRMIIKLGKLQRFRTINVVRRREQVDELKRLGADAVIVSGEEAIEDAVKKLTEGKGAPFAVDPVGGATGAALAASLGANGRMLVYGTLSWEPMPLDPRVLISGQKCVAGFWLSEWAPAQGIVTMLRLFRQITDLLRQGVLTTEATTPFPMAEVASAVRQAETPGHGRKVLLRIGSS